TRPASGGRVEIRPGPTKQLVFYWSATRGAAPPAPDGLMAAPTQLQAGGACLGDFSSSLVEVGYHIAYRVEAGRVDSLVWLIPAAYVLESIQAPQLAGYRFELVDNGDRRMLIEFSRPQTGDFSLAATFAFPVGRNAKQFPLALIDPV